MSMAIPTTNATAPRRLDPPELEVERLKAEAAKLVTILKSVSRTSAGHCWCSERYISETGQEQGHSSSCLAAQAVVAEASP